METPRLWVRTLHDRSEVRMEVFPERDGNSHPVHEDALYRSWVRMEVFPERDGNSHPVHEDALYRSWVRMEVFPERDGNWSE